MIDYYGIHKTARDGSMRTLIDCNVRELPVRPVAIAKHYGIVCKETSPEALRGAAGRIMAIDGRVYIVISSADPPQRKRYTILHELGHYLLGHLGNTPLSRSYSSIRPPNEIAADKFAADLLMPACVLWALDIHSPIEIMRLCDVSMQAASIRAERMRVLYQRNKFLTLPLERQVYAQFGDFIQKYRRV